MWMFSSGRCSLWLLAYSNRRLLLILPLHIFHIVLQLYRYLFHFTVDILRDLIQIVMGLPKDFYFLISMFLFLNWLTERDIRFNRIDICPSIVNKNQLNLVGWLISSLRYLFADVWALVCISMKSIFHQLFVLLKLHLLGVSLYFRRL
jgi:hypothetical protein